MIPISIRVILWKLAADLPWSPVYPHILDVLVEDRSTEELVSMTVLEQMRFITRARLKEWGYPDPRNLRARAKACYLLYDAYIAIGGA